MKITHHTAVRKPIHRRSQARVSFALSGLDISRDLSQGVALGYHMAPLWGF